MKLQKHQTLKNYKPITKTQIIAAIITIRISNLFILVIVNIFSSYYTTSRIFESHPSLLGSHFETTKNSIKMCQKEVLKKTFMEIDYSKVILWRLFYKSSMQIDQQSSSVNKFL